MWRLAGSLGPECHDEVVFGTLYQQFIAVGLEIVNIVV